MKIIYFAAYYEKYLQAFYKRYGDFGQLSYAEQQALMTQDYFGVFGAYASHAADAGHETQLIVVNCEPMQRRWAQENGVPFNKDWRQSVAIAQVRKFAPDVFFIGSMFDYYGSFLDAISPYCRKIYGWVACPIPKGTDFSQFSLILSSAHHFVDNFRNMGVPSEYLPAAFDEKIWDRFRNTEKKYDVSFVGGLSSIHKHRVETLRSIARKTPVDVWGYGYDDPRGKVAKFFRPDPIVRRFHGEAWGSRMFEIFAQSKISLNVHIAEAGDQAGNMRMYEATGMGTLLLTDKKGKSPSLWEAGKEMVEYDSPEDAVEKIRYYLIHEKEREAIAAAGQKRTLEHFNFHKNIQLMLEHFKKHL